MPNSFKTMLLESRTPDYVMVKASYELIMVITEYTKAIIPDFQMVDLMELDSSMDLGSLHDDELTQEKTELSKARSWVRKMIMTNISRHGIRLLAFNKKKLPTSLVEAYNMRYDFRFVNLT